MRNIVVAMRTLLGFLINLPPTMRAGNRRLLFVIPGVPVPFLHCAPKVQHRSAQGKRAQLAPPWVQNTTPPNLLHAEGVRQLQRRPATLGQSAIAQSLRQTCRRERGLSVDACDPASTVPAPGAIRSPNATNRVELSRFFPRLEAWVAFSPGRDTSLTRKNRANELGPASPKGVGRK